MTIKNGDMPAMPIEINGFGQFAPEVFIGLTKREMLCLYNSVADTGDDELDSIIKEGNRQKFAMSAMQGLIAASNDCFSCAENAVDYADALLSQLEQTK